MKGEGLLGRRDSMGKDPGGGKESSVCRCSLGRWGAAGHSLQGSWSLDGDQVDQASSPCQGT